MGRAQTIVCTARAQPQAKQSVAPRKNRLPNKPEKQPSNATEPVLIGYARVSRTEGQDLTPQVDALQAAGCRRIHEERASGGRWDRPELTRLLDRLAAGNVLVVWKLDRLSRSLKDLLLILERIGAAGAGFRCFIPTEPPPCWRKKSVIQNTTSSPISTAPTPISSRC